ncbi:MAG TPA: DUF1186 domain-containing protein [Verrucomicrobiae bacterium]|jgi:hypothetical protein
MHVISNDRALEHWKALNSLPPGAIDLLSARFIREQPPLAAAVLHLANGLVSGLDGVSKIPKDDDPRLNDFWKLATSGAIMNEIVCREAGRHLRKLTSDEVSALTEECLSTLEAFNDGVRKGTEKPANLFASCSQRELLSGIALSHWLNREPEMAQLPGEILALRIMAEGLHHACGDEPPNEPRSWDTERIQIALSAQGDPLRREALSVCEVFRAELIPDFLKELEWQAMEPKSALEEYSPLGMHAMFLLAKWRESSAWPVFRKLFSLPGDIGYELMGDVITEDASILLAMVGANHSDELRAMVEDEALDEYCRGACLDALTCLVAWGQMPRAQHVAFLRELLTGKLRVRPENEHAFANAVSAACDLEAWELQPEIESAFDRGAVDDGFVDFEFFLDAKAGKFGSQWEKFCENHQPIADVAAATEWLDEPPPPLGPLPSEEDDFDLPAEPLMPYIAPPKIGRNQPCPCGSGKKYKKCCGA